MTILSNNNCFVKTGGRFFQILWSSHNILTLPAEINWDEETAAAQNPIVHTEKISFSDIPLVILALYSSEYNTAKYWSTPATKFGRIKASQWMKIRILFEVNGSKMGSKMENYPSSLIINILFVTEENTEGLKYRAYRLNYTILLMDKICPAVQY